MIAHKNYRPPTKYESERIDRMMELPCPCCVLAKYFFRDHIECHHIVEGAKRLGHWFTLPLCRGHHRGEWSVRQRETMEPKFLIAISDGRKLFVAAFAPERQLWEGVQKTLGLPAVWRASKILPRRVA